MCSAQGATVPSSPVPAVTLSLPITLAVVDLGVVVGKVEETLDPVQGHFGLQEAIDHPREVVERKNEHAYQCQGREYLGWGGDSEGLSYGGPVDGSAEGRTGQQQN